MTANVRVVVAERKDVLLVPNAALRFKPRLDRAPGENKGEGRERKREGRGEGRNKSPIFVPDGERFHPVFVSAGISDGLFTEVSDGLTEGQAIIVDSAKSAGGGSGANPMGGPRSGGGGGPPVAECVAWACSAGALENPPR